MRRIALIAGGSALLLLSGCTTLAVPVETPAPQFAARQLAAVGLTVDDLGAGWTQLPGDEGEGGGPTTDVGDLGDPCTWVSEWLPDSTAFSTHSWRMYSAGDGTYASDWLAAAAPGADLLAELEAFGAAVSACEVHTYPEDNSTVQITPTEHPDLGDAAFSYLATFTGPDGSSWGLGEVHTVVCGPLWLHLSYVGYDPFIERDALLATLVDRASELGGC